MLVNSARVIWKNIDEDVVSDFKCLHGEFPCGINIARGTRGITGGVFSLGVAEQFIPNNNNKTLSLGRLVKLPPSSPVSPVRRCFLKEFPRAREMT